MLLIWLGFILFVLLMLALDLGVFHREAHVVSFREALAWSAVWIAMGLAFAIFVYYGYESHWMGLGSAPDPADGMVNDGWNATVKYITGYVVEKSLSVDNVFVIALIFTAFSVPAMFQHRVLFWGILGALLMRGIMIGVGAKLIAEFHWILYVFGAFLVLTGIKMLFGDLHPKNPGDHFIVRWTRRWIPVTEHFHGEHFVVRAGSAASQKPAYPGAPVQTDRVLEKARPGSILLTPLALALIMVEFTDLIFAVDSIPAIFAITGDPFLVFTSNVFAILGLRSLYFALAGLLDLFRYLKVSLAIILILVGVKLLAADWLKESLGKNFSLYLLVVVMAILAIGIIASIMLPKKETEHRIASATGEDGHH